MLCQVLLAIVFAQVPTSGVEASEVLRADAREQPAGSRTGAGLRRERRTPASSELPAGPQPIGIGAGGCANGICTGAVPGWAQL